MLSENGTGSPSPGSKIRLGPIELEHPFILAPMAGITSSPFRRWMRRMGASMVVSELVSANGIRHAGRKTLELLRFHEEERPIGLQLFGEDAGNLVEAAKKVEELGADFVDLNLGCPVPKVVRKGAGAAMCRDPIALGSLLGSLVRATRIPLSIKIRTGWDAGSRNAGEIARVAADAGVAWLAIHGRTRAQGYSGLSDWDYIAEVKSKAVIPVIGNGDLATPEQAVLRLRDSGVDAVMIGRGALRDPFLFQSARALWNGESFKLPASLASALRELRLFQESERGADSAALSCKKLLAWYSAGFPGCHEFRRRVFASSGARELWDLAEDFFARASPRDSRYLSEAFLMGGHG